MASNHVTLVTALQAIFWVLIRGDYKCVCSDHNQRTVYKTDSSQYPLGFVYKGTCLQQLDVQNIDPSFAALAYYHQLTFMKLDYLTSKKTCAGDPPQQHIVTTPSGPQAGTSSVMSSTAVPSSSNVPSPSPTQTATTATVSTVSQSSSHVQSFPINSTKTATTTISMSTSTATAVASKSAVPLTSKAVQFTPAPTTTANSIVAGRIDLCPLGVRDLAHLYFGTVGQRDNKCYILINRFAYNWNSASYTCQLQGGHLVEILSADEQRYLENFFRQSGQLAPVWLGLNDQRFEGHYQWSSGRALGYSHWAAQFESVSHFSEDCVTMDMLDRQGHWDDQACFFKHAFVCEFYTQMPIVG